MKINSLLFSKKMMLLALVSVVYLSGYGQTSSSKKYIKILVSGNITENEARSIDSLIRTKEGVLTSRMDRNTGVYLGITEEVSGLTIINFKAWIHELGFETRCAVTGLLDGTPTIPLSRENCLENDVFNEK